jgi:hypothetical protein
VAKLRGVRHNGASRALKNIKEHGRALKLRREVKGVWV